MKKFYLIIVSCIFLANIVTAQTINMSNTTQNSVCSGTYYDNGGASNYSNSRNYTQTFYPSAGNRMSFNFTSFATENTFDFLYIYNGNTVNAANLIGTYTGSTSPGTVTSTAADGSLTFRFTSDNNTVASGWVASISCIPTYKSQFISIDYGTSPWCAGETRSVTVKWKNIGTATWTDGAGGTPDINVGLRWDLDPDYGSPPGNIARVSAGNLAPGATGTYIFNIVTPVIASGTDHLRSDVVYEGAFWFRGVSGNVEYTSPNITIAAPTSNPGSQLSAICINGTTSGLGGSVGGSATGGTWSSSVGGTFNPNANTLNATWTPPLNYTGTASLTLTTISGCANVAASKNQVVNAIPTASAGGSQTICPTGAATVSGASSSNGAISWIENGAGSITAGATTLTPTYTAAAGDAGNTVTLTMTVSNSPCASASAIYTVYVSKAPSITTQPVTTQTTCSGSTVNFSVVASGTATLTYQWKKNGVSIGGANSSTFSIPSAVVGDAGTYSVVVTNSCGTATSGNSVLIVNSVGSWLGLTGGANNWFITTNWGCGVIPTATTDVTIPASAPNMPNINAALAVCQSITINGSLSISGANNLDVYGDWINNGTFTNATGSVSFRGGTNNLLAGTTATTFYNLIINKTATANTVTSTTSVFTTTNLTVTQGNLILTSPPPTPINVSYSVTGNITVPATGILTDNVNWDANGHLLSVGGNIAIDGIFNYTGGNMPHVNMNGAGSKTVRTGNNPASGFGYLTFYTGDYSASGNLVINNNFWAMFGTAAGSFSTNGQVVTAKLGLLIHGGTVNINGGTLNVTGGMVVGYPAGLSGIVNLTSGTLNADGVTVGPNTPAVNGVFNQSGGTANIGNLLINNTTTASVYNCTNSPIINITGNFTNNETFNAASSQVNFNGGAIQTIDGTSQTTFNNLKIANAAGVNLNTSASVNSTLDLTSGLINTGGNVITVAATGTIINNSASSYVNGKLARIFTTSGAKLFPIGAGGNYRPLNFNYTSLTGTSTITVQQFETAIAGTYTGGVTSQPRHYDITQNGGSNLNYFITLDPTGYTPAGLVQILKYEASTPGIQPATTPNYTNTNAYTTFNNTNNGTNSFALGADCSSFVNAGPDIEVCQGGTTGSLAGSISGTATGALWTTPSGGTFNPNANTLNATWTPPALFSGAATLTLTTSGGACGPASDTKIVTVNAQPTGAITTSTSSTCAGTSVLFTAPAGYLNYEFFKGATSLISSGSNSYSISNLVNGDVITVLITTTKGCTATLTAPAVFIYAIPFGTFDASENSGLAANDNIICQGAPVSFSFDAGFTNYKFMVNGVMPAAQDGPSRFYNTTTLNDGDNVTLVVTGAGGCTKTFGPITIQVKPLPTGILKVEEASGTPNDNSICVGENVKFTAPAGYTTYDFKVNGVSVVNPSNIYNTTLLNDGDQVSVIVTNSNGCTLTLGPVTITVYALPTAPTITAGGSTKFCIGGSVLLTSSAATTYQWYQGGVAIGGATSQTYLASTGGNYTVSITDGHTCGATSAAVTVTVDPLPAVPNIAAGGLTAFCDGGSVKLTSSVSDNGYQWNVGGTPIAGETNQTYTATTSGVYTVTITNLNGCQNTSAGTTVTVHPLPGIPTITAGGSTTFCSGVNVTLTSSNATSYQWYQDGTLIAGATGQNYVATTSGAYTVKVGDGFQCKSTSLPISVTANPLPDPTLNGPNPICPGSTGTYITESGFSNYSWSYTGGTLVGGGGLADTSITITWDQPGAKTVFVNYENTFGCKASKNKTVTTSTNPLPTIVASQPDNVCIDYSGNIYTTETTAGITGYVWTIVGGTIDLGQGTSSVSVTWNTAGPQTISVNYANAAGCTAVSPTVHNVNVHPLPIATFIYTDGKYCANGEDPLPAKGSGAVFGTFTSDAGLVINPVTGEVDLSASSAGTHTVTNTIAAANGCNMVYYNSDITITAVPSVEISYGTPFCKDNSNAQKVTFTNKQNDWTGGAFSAASGLTIDGTSGDIIPSTSTPGTYTVFYIIHNTNGCGDIPATTSVTITALPTSTISYGGSPYCTSLTGAQSVTLGGTGAYMGGGYTASPGGLSINSTTGAIIPSTSTAGTYTVTYSTVANGGCGVTTSTASVTITAMPTATIAYAGTPFCSSTTLQAVTISGGTGVYTPGTFSSDMNLSIVAGSGDINPSLSTLGTHTVSYLITPSGGCIPVAVTTDINITPAAVAVAGPAFSTCASNGAINITAGSSATNGGTVTWSSSGTGAFTNINSLTLATYNPSAADITAGSVILTLTVNGLNNCGLAISTKKLTINPNPPTVIINPSTASLCQGTIQSLTSTNTSTTGIITGTFPAGTAIPDANFFGIATSVNLAGLPVGAIVDSIQVSVQITHNRTNDLFINLKAPNGKVLNLANNIGTATGAFTNFSTPIFSSASSKPIQTFGTNPYNGYFAPMAQPGIPGAAALPGGTQYGPATFSDLFSVIGGNWSISVRDGTTGISGTLNAASIRVYYSQPAAPVNLTWSPAADLYSDAAATIPYAGQLLSTVYVKPSVAGLMPIKGTATNPATGCTNSSIANLTVKPTPVVTIEADYCTIPNNVILTARPNGAASYNWSNGATTQSITVNIANNYFVSVANAQGCVSTALATIAQELVVNGDFTQGNVGFTSDYNYKQDVPGLVPAGQGELWDDSGKNGYSISDNGQNVHINFWGIDHTNNQTGARNMMLVNGHGNTLVVWKETVFVKANTDYYFSAWAMSLNAAGNNATLQFNVDGALVGTTLSLADGPTSTPLANANNYWKPFYSNPLWHNSGPDRSIEIQIVDLQTALGGNDFAIDDISFATLSPFVTSPTDGTDHQTVCEGDSILHINYLVGSGTGGPAFSVLPSNPGLTSTWDGRTFSIIGTSLAPGSYTYTVSTSTPCANPKAATGTLVVNPKGTISLTSIGNDIQERCINTNIAPINYAFGGGGTGVTFAGLPPGMNKTFDPATKTATISGNSSVPGIYNYTITTTGTCAQKSLGGVITISDASNGGSITQPTICLGDNGTLTLSGRLGNVVKWQVSNDKITYLDVANTDTFLVSPPITQSTFYRAVLQNGSCPTAYSNGGKLRIKNLWEGEVDNTWISQNWSAGILPDNSCANTVTIPKVIPGYSNPVLTTIQPVTNLNILTGGNLTINGGTLQVAGSIANAGILDATLGTMEFNGNSQTTNGSIFKNNTIQNVIVSSTGASTLTVTGVSADTMKITGTLSFGNGNAKLNSGDHITLVSTANATANVGIVGTNNAIDGKFTVERFIPALKAWRFMAVNTQPGQYIHDAWQEGEGTNLYDVNKKNRGISLPGEMTGFAALGFDLKSAAPAMKWYDPATDKYVGITSTNIPFDATKGGYLTFIRGDRSANATNSPVTFTTLRTTGKLFTGTMANISVKPNVFQPVNNPFAASIDLSKIMQASGNKQTIFFYVYDPRLGVGSAYGYGAFQTLSWNSLSSTYEATPGQASYGAPYNSNPNLIQSGQAFWVSSYTVTDALPLDENKKSVGSTGGMLFRQQGPDEGGKFAQLRTSLFINTPDHILVDGTLQQVSQDYVNDVDGMDAKKLANPAENLSIKTANKLLVIERRAPYMTQDTVFYNMTGMRAQNYQFQFDAQGLSTFGTEGWVEDSYLHTKTVLNLEGMTTVDFSVTNVAGTYAADRFRIVFQAAAGPLPVTIVSVKATQKDADIAVEWKVDNQSNMKEYQVEKSLDGNRFNNVGTIAANTNNASVYNFLDKNAPAGYNFYRIRSIGKDGQQTVTQIVRVLIQRGTPQITIHPNPITNGVINLHLINEPSGMYGIRLLNPLGQTIVSKQVSHADGTSTEQIQWNYNLAHGVYQLEVTRPDASVKVIKVMY